MTFVDSSALVAFVCNEADGTWVRAALLAATAVAANELVRGECSSAILRKARTGMIAADTVPALIDSLDSWFADADTLPDTTAADIASATTLCRRIDLALRMPDAIHLAQCRRLGLALLTRDRAMAAAAVAIGLQASLPG
jgi:uncharacterized protein